MKKIPLAACIVLYNPNKNHIDNVYNVSKMVDLLIVVDNTEDNIIRINETNNVHYHKTNNLGIAYALNYSANYAIKKQYNYLLTLDQDSIISCDDIKKMMNFYEKNRDKKIGIVSPYHLIKTVEEIPTIKIEEKLEVMTSGNIIELNAFKKIGGFKEWLFIDGVDIEYGLNLNKHGYKVIRLNYIKMKHELGNAKIHNILGKKVLCSNHNKYRRYYMIRNNLYINKMYKDIYPEYCKFLINVQKGQIKRVIFLEKNKLSKLYYSMKGYFDFKNGNKGKLGK